VSQLSGDPALITPLLFKEKIKRLLCDKRGFSSIVGAIFAVLAMMSLFTTVFLWMISQNTFYNEEVKARNQLEIDRLNERIKASRTNYTIYTNGKISVTTELQNIGPLSVQLTTIWVYISNASCNVYNFTRFSNAYLKAGANSTFNVEVSVAGISSSSTYKFTSWLITGRGNVVPLEEYTGKILIASVAQGIGALQNNFEDFKYYNVTKQGSIYVLANYPNGASGYLVNQGGEGIAFQVLVTNLDENERTIVLLPSSVLFSMFPTTEQQIRAAFWYIVNVNGSGVISSTYTPVTLSFGVETRLYFASYKIITGGDLFSPSKASFTKTAPVNLALIGTIGGSPYGQNIPFVSIYINN